MIGRVLSLCVLVVLTTPLLWAGNEEDAPPKAKADGKAAAPPDTGAEARHWDQVQKQLKKISDDLADLKKRVELGEQARAEEVKTFQERFGQLEKSLESLRATTRTSSAFTPGTPGATGTIRLHNRSSVTATVFVHDRPYQVAPGETRVLSGQPAGNFTYFVLAEGFGEIRAPLTRALGSGETFTITINP